METSLKTFASAIAPSREPSSEADGAIHLHDLKFQNLAEYISQPVWVVRATGCGEYFNPFWVRYTGLSGDESFDFGWSRALHPEDLGNFMKLLRNAGRSTDCECEVRLRRADASYRWHLCRCSPLASQSKGIVRLLVCCTDVEERHHAEASAREQGKLVGWCVRGHDQEKRKIAHGLHDSAGQYLVALQMKLDGLQRCSMGNTGRKNPIVDECRELVKRCSRELRATSYLLYPPLLDDLGLESAVRLHVDGLMERTRATIELDIEPNLGRLDRDLEIALFRVVQEALAALSRQSGSNDIGVKIRANPTTVLVEVRGAGSETQPVNFPTGPNVISAFNAAALRQRILEAGGVFEIEALSSATVVRAAVPRRALVTQVCD